MPSTGRKPVVAATVVAAANTTPRRPARNTSSTSLLPPRVEAPAAVDRSPQTTMTTLGVVTDAGSGRNAVRRGLPARRRASEAADGAAAINDDYDSLRKTDNRALFPGGSSRERGEETQARQRQSVTSREVLVSGKTLGAGGIWGGAQESPAPAWR